MTLHLNKNGVLDIFCDFIKFIDITTCNNILIELVNPVINILNNEIQSGIKLNNFKNIIDDNVIINNINYTLHIPVKYKVSKNLLLIVYIILMWLIIKIIYFKWDINGFKL